MRQGLGGCLGALTAVAITSFTLSGAVAETGGVDLEHLPRITDEMVRDAVLDLTPSIITVTPSVVSLKAVVEEAQRESKPGAVVLTSDVLFGYNSAALSPAAAKAIAAIAAKVPQATTVEVGGHTDSHADDAYNLKLSAQRAAAVAKVLTTARPDLKVTAKGYGESQPVADNGSPTNDNPEGRAKNRRVEIRYTG